MVECVSLTPDKYVYSEWEKDVLKFVHKTQTTLAKDFDLNKSPFRVGVGSTGPEPKDERLKYLEVGSLTNHRI